MCGDEDATLEAAESENEDTPADGAAIQDCTAAQEASSSSRCKKKKKKKKKHKNEQKNEESKQQKWHGTYLHKYILYLPCKLFSRILLTA